MKIRPEEPSFDPADWSGADADAELAAGVRLFDAGEYHAAHEAFERIWLSKSGGDSDFFKGLIQAAICLHHFARGNLEGARGLYAGHRRYLAAFRPSHLGIDVGLLLADMQRFLAPVLRAGAEERVAFDASAAPRLQSPPPSPT